MTKIVQLAGGAADQQNQYTGPARELTVDESNHELRLHDGVTPGGHIIQNRDNADQRYQPKSSELSGLTGFEPEQRGFLVRLGANDYRLRTLTVNGSQLSMTNPTGYGGNPQIGLADTIATDHVWTGQHIAEEVWQFNAGINADVSGDTNGTHNGPVVGNVTGNLTGNSSGTHTGPAVGPVDVRGESLQLDNGQIPTAAINGLLDFVTDNGIPAGVIVLWSGSVAGIPAGWFLCNGANSTPDLRDRFIVGAGSASYPVGTVGGSDSVTPVVTLTAGGAHTHSLSGDTASAATGVTLNKSIVRPEYEQHQVDVVGNVTLTDPGHVHALGGQADSNGSHTHAAASSSIDLRPKFYALCYIMKGV